MNHLTAKICARNIAQLMIILLCALALKQFYSTANVNELRWILAPTTFLVQFISGTRFQFEYYAGYISSDHSFIIAASCAGVNFLLTAFLMLSLGRRWRVRSQKFSWISLPAAAGFAYLATIVANTARICLALWLRTISHDVGWIDQEQLHRLEGIVVYFGFLLLLFVYQQKYSTRLRNLQSEPKAGPRPRTLYDFRFPLLIYYGTAVGIPLLTAVYRQTEVPVDFQQHLLFVLFIPLVIIVPCECFRRYEHNRKTPKPTSTVSLVSSTR